MWQVEWHYSPGSPRLTAGYPTKDRAEDWYNARRREGCWARLERVRGSESELLREANVPRRERVSRVQERIAQVSATLQANAEAFNNAVRAAIPSIERTLGSPVRFSGTTVLGASGGVVGRGGGGGGGMASSGIIGAAGGSGSIHNPAPHLGGLDLPPAWLDRAREWADAYPSSGPILLQGGRRAGRTHLNETMQRFQDMAEAALPLTRDNEPVECADPGCVHTDPKKEMA